MLKQSNDLCKTHKDKICDQWETLKSRKKLFCTIDVSLINHSFNNNGSFGKLGICLQHCIGGWGKTTLFQIMGDDFFLFLFFLFLFFLFLFFLSFFLSFFLLVLHPWRIGAGGTRDSPRLIYLTLSLRKTNQRKWESSKVNCANLHNSKLTKKHATFWYFTHWSIFPILKIILSITYFITKQKIYSQLTLVTVILRENEKCNSNGQHDISNFTFLVL